MEKPAKGKDPSIEDVEKSLFADAAECKKEPEIGLLKKPEKSAFTKANKDDGDFDEKKSITISFSPKTFAKSVFVVLFVVLLFFFFYNPFYGYFPWNKGTLTGGAVIDADDPAKAVDNDDAGKKQAETADQDEAAAETDEQQKAKNNETAAGKTDEDANATDEKETITEGDVAVRFESIQTDVKSWGGKISKVDYVIENNGFDFVPKIQIVAYDQKTRPDFVQWPVIHAFDTVLPKGKMLKGSVDLGKYQFQEIKTPKTVELKLYDEGGEKGKSHDKLLAKIEQEVNITAKI